MLRAEAKVMRRLYETPAAQVAKVVHTGLHNEHFFIVMDCLGSSLAAARKAADSGRFDLPTVAAVAASTLRALEAMHRCGFIHRDVKPANFCLSSPTAAVSTGAPRMSRADVARLKC